MCPPITTHPTIPTPGSAARLCFSISACVLFIIDMPTLRIAVTTRGATRVTIRIARIADMGIGRVLATDMDTGTVEDIVAIDCALITASNQGVEAT